MGEYRDRDDRFRGRDDEDRHYARTRWGSGDYRENYSRGEWDADRAGGRYGVDRDGLTGEPADRYARGSYGPSYGRDFADDVYGADYDRTGGTRYDSRPATAVQWGTGPAARQSFRGRGPKGFQRSDDRLRELVSERLEEHDAIDASDIEVAVAGGEVTLTGTVDDRRTKRLAEDVAGSVTGIRDVHNQLKVDRGFFRRMAEGVRDAVHRDRD